MRFFLRRIFDFAFFKNLIIYLWSCVITNTCRWWARLSLISSPIRCSKMFRWPRGIPGNSTRASSSGWLSRTLISSLITRNLWKRTPTRIFIWLIRARCGACGRFCKITPASRFLVIRRRRASLESQCCCRYARILMLSSIFRRRDWTASVTITAMR